MSRAYSLDLRERVVASVDSGRSRRETALLFGVSAATAVRWCARAHRTGSPAALRMGGRWGLKLAPERDWLVARIVEKPDLTLRAIQGELADRGIGVSLKAIWNFLQVEKLTFKKKPARRRARSAGRGAQAGAVEEVPGTD
jgi:transposase